MESNAVLHQPADFTNIANKVECTMKTALLHFAPALTLSLALALPCNVFAARMQHAPLLRHAEGDGAAERMPAQTAAETIKNDFFSVTLPAGWSGQETKNVAPNGANAVFKKGRLTAVTLTMTRTGADNRQIAEKTAEKMRRRGMEVSEPVEKNGFYTIDISKKRVNGKGWFGKNGDISAITIIIAPKIDEADDLLKAVRPVADGLVPRTAK